MDYENKSKNYYSSQDAFLDEKSFKLKTFNLFYEISQQKQYNIWTLSILYLLETIQLISYAFDEPHKSLWRIKSSNIDQLSTILSAARITSLMKFINFTIYVVIFTFLIVIIFGLFLFLLMEILLCEFQTKIYKKCVYVTNMVINPINIFLYIPISELILLPLKCKNGVVDIIKNGTKCYENLHYLYLILGIIGNILLFISTFFLINFYFFPFNINNINNINGCNPFRITQTNEIILLISKFLFVYRYILIKDEYISILILFLLNTFLLVNEFHNSTYNNYALSLISNIKNISIFWTYFILLVCKILEKTDIDGLIYMLLFGYPFIIFCFVIFLNKKELNYDSINDKFDNIDNYLLKTSYKIGLIDSFLDNNKNIINNYNSEYQKNEILLKGLIQKHNETCLNEDCPLIKFRNNPGNYYIQKQCLLNYMNIYFEKGIKRFQNSIFLLIYYVQFNYSKRYNLNSVRENLSRLKKMPKNIHEEYIIYCIEENVKKMKNKRTDNSDNNEQELEKDLVEMKLQRLKFLIESSTKLYGEFWGIFATNITNNLNTIKLYTLGEKLNNYINEINSIWDNDIKRNTIDKSHQGIIQLYSHFLKDILWNKKKSDEINKKINDEHRYHEMKKNDEENFHGNNLEAILENQDYTFFCSSNDKGKCTIIQCSNSITNLLGYEKADIIGKSIEVLMPNILIEGHMKNIEDYIKNLNIAQKNPHEFSKGNDHNQIFLLPKNKTGYILPYFCKFIIYDDNDFSNSYIIKAKLEPKENKTLYTYYILTKRDFTVNYISSSTLHLGLSMDLLKKYMIKLDILIRTNDDRNLKLEENLEEMEEKEIEIKWVYPDIIYPKNNLRRKENEYIENLIKYSKKENFLLKITVFRNDNEEILGICFRIMEKNKNLGKNIKFENFIPKVQKEFLFDILSLNYIRAIIVDKKSGKNNLRDKDNIKEKNDKNNQKRTRIQSTEKKETKTLNNNNNLIEEDEDGIKKEFILTKEKINEMQGENCSYIKNIIDNLSFYGRDVQLEKHRPNKERFPTGRIQEPKIKILVANFIESLQKNLRLKLANNQNNFKNLGEGDSSSFDKKISDHLNREFKSDTSTSLSNIFNGKSILYIKIISLLIIILTIALVFLEFIFTFIHLKDIKARILYLEYGYQLLSNMVYIKYFISEAIFANEIPKKFPLNNNNNINNNIPFYYNEAERVNYIIKIKKELAEYLVLFNRLLNNFNSATITLSDDYLKFTSSVKMGLYTITISDSGEKESLINETFSSAMRRIPSDVFYISSNTDPGYIIDMKNQNCFELMQNILNVFYTTWKEATVILFKDVKSHCSKSTLSYILLFSSFIITIICLFLVYKLLLIFSNDREKPINLFLTIKKNIFEELKNASEGFSNKLLNKFFGNEENEEETHLDYTTNIKENDINIVKFKSPNEHKLTGNRDKTNIIVFMQLTFFLIFCNAYIIFKFCYTYDNIQNISRFIDVFNTTHNTHTDLILSIDVIKSYLFDDSIPIFNRKNKEEIFHEFLNVFYKKSNSFEETILSTSKSNSFLDNNYKDKFYEYLYHEYFDLVQKDINHTLIEKNNTNIFSQVLNQLLEKLKFITLKYLNYGYKEKREEFEYGYPSTIIGDKIWIEVDELTTIYIRFWFKNILEMMMESLDDYVNRMRLIHITIFVVLVIIIVFAYCIVWKNYEKQLKNMLKRSFNLINLIPEEIKYMIVSKLNE